MIDDSLWSVWTLDQLLDTPVRCRATGYSEQDITDSLPSAVGDDCSSSGKNSITFQAPERAPSWVLRACRLAGSRGALGGSFAAAILDERHLCIIMCTDFMGRQPLYYRIRHSAEFRGMRLELSLFRPKPDGEVAWIRHHPRTRLLVDANGQVTMDSAAQLGGILGLDGPAAAAAGPCRSEKSVPGTTTNDVSETQFQPCDGELAAEELQQLLLRCVSYAWRACGGHKQVGVLFSGGVDSCLLAKLLTTAGASVHLFTGAFHEEGLKEPEDALVAVAAAEALGLPLHVERAPRGEVAELLATLAPAIEDLNVVKAGVAVTMALAARGACRTLGPGAAVFSGLGTEECWAGYARFASAGESRAASLGLMGLQDMWHRDLQRDWAAAASQGASMFHPYLHADLLRFALARVPGELKLGPEGREKILLRRAAVAAGLPEQLCWRPKRAAQYGSRVHYALDRLFAKPYGGGEKVTKVGTVMGTPGASHSSFAILLSGTGSLHALRTARLLRIPVACGILQSGDPLCAAAARIAAGIAGIPIHGRMAPCLQQGHLQDGSSLTDEFVWLLCEVRAEWNIAGILSGIVADVERQLLVSCACDSAGLKAIAPIWAAPSPARLLAQACSERLCAVLLRAPAVGITGASSVSPDGSAAVVITSPEDATRLMEEIEAAFPGTSHPDTGATELLLLPADCIPADVAQMPRLDVSSLHRWIGSSRCDDALPEQLGAETEVVSVDPQTLIKYWRSSNATPDFQPPKQASY